MIIYIPAVNFQSGLRTTIYFDVAAACFVFVFFHKCPDPCCCGVLRGSVLRKPASVYYGTINFLQCSSSPSAITSLSFRKWIATRSTEALSKSFVFSCIGRASAIPVNVSFSRWRRECANTRVLSFVL